MLKKIWTKVTGEVSIRRGICPLCKNDLPGGTCPACLGTAAQYASRPGAIVPVLKRRWRKYHKRGE